MKKPWEQPVGENTEKYLMQYIHYDENSRLLDFGAGFGRYLNVFAKYLRKENLYGAEIDDDSLAMIKEQGFNCYKPDFDNPHIPFQVEFFDYIFCSNVIEHIPNVQYKIYLHEFYRVLKKNGTLLIGTPNYPIKRIYDIKKAFQTKMYKYYLLDDPTHINKLSIRRLEKDLKKIFPVVHLNPTYIFFENESVFIWKHRLKLRILGDKIMGYCKK